MVTVKPLLSAAGAIAKAFLLTVPVCLIECLLVKFMGSVENGLGQPLFFKRNAELLRVMAQVISVDILPCKVVNFATVLGRSYDDSGHFFEIPHKDENANVYVADKELEIVRLQLINYLFFFEEIAKEGELSPIHRKRKSEH